MSAYLKLEKHFAQIADFQHASGILEWDNAAMMPAGSADVRADAMATLHVHVHKLSTDPAHIILRYEMEQKLIAGSMSVSDIPEA